MIQSWYLRRAGQTESSHLIPRYLGVQEQRLVLVSVVYAPVRPVAALLRLLLHEQVWPSTLIQGVRRLYFCVCAYARFVEGEN